MTPLRAVAFDLDDTLYPERSYALSGFAAVARWAEGALGIPAESGYRELAASFEAGVRGDTFNRWLEAHGRPVDPWLKQMIQVYRDHEPSIEPYPDVPPVLHDLRKRTRLALITQGYRPGQQRKLRALNLADHFESVVILGEEDREHWKPSLRPYEMLLDQLGLPGEQVAYVGDNPSRDFFGARKLGLTTLRVRREGGEHAEEEAPTPEHASRWEVSDFRAMHLFLAPRLQAEA